ncbi:hypothetical protein [Zavarzinella formosa]|uniref:hypothetical protein n=1 Tax=Zavarzinella formosa TaxID=360055 RepID=UPI0002D6B909|nr:hypothetical protein [Zavarzinella formosa]
MSEPTTNPSIPYRLERHPGAGRLIPFKIYPNGDQRIATEEEAVMWDAYVSLMAQRDEALKAVGTEPKTKKKK